MGNTIALVDFPCYSSLAGRRFKGHRVLYDQEKDRYFSGHNRDVFQGASPTPFTLPTRVCQERAAYTSRVVDCVTFTAANDQRTSQAHLNWGHEQELWARIFQRSPFQDQDMRVPRLAVMDDKQFELGRAGKQKEVYDLVLGRDLEALKANGDVSALIAGGVADRQRSIILQETLEGVAAAHDVPYSEIVGSRHNPPCKFSVFSAPEEHVIALNVNAQQGGSDILDLSTLKRAVEKVAISPEDRLLVPGDKEYGPTLDKLEKVADSLRMTPQEQADMYFPEFVAPESAFKKALSRTLRRFRA